MVPSVFDSNQRPLPIVSSGRFTETSSNPVTTGPARSLRSGRQPHVGIGINNAQKVPRIASASVIWIGLWSERQPQSTSYSTVLIGKNGVRLALEIADVKAAGNVPQAVQPADREVFERVAPA